MFQCSSFKKYIFDNQEKQLNGSILSYLHFTNSKIFSINFLIQHFDRSTQDLNYDISNLFTWSLLFAYHYSFADLMEILQNYSVFFIAWDLTDLLIKVYLYLQNIDWSKFQNSVFDDLRISSIDILLRMFSVSRFRFHRDFTSHANAIFLISLCRRRELLDFRSA